jgi:uncharacterized SAM-binding protein YcdF (DUF218 family)
MKRKIIIFLIFALVLASGLFLLRTSILEGFAKFLIVETEFEQVEYGFVLSGNALDRGAKAAQLYYEGKVAHLVCTGIDTLESDLSILQLLKHGVPESKLTQATIGTSTQEEADFILNFAQENQLKELLIISSLFHTRRINQVFTEHFKDEGIMVHIAGAPSSLYVELEWWKSEYGLIALNNEYLKQLYYLVYY